jgi:hypothetical protein
MAELDKLPQRLELDFEPGTVFVIEVAELDERMQGLAGGWEWPIIDHVEFGLRGAVAVAGQIMANVFNTFLEEITFAQFQG